MIGVPLTEKIIPIPATTKHRYIYESGAQFGAWTVRGFCGWGSKRQYLWMCECECGTIRPVCGVRLRNGGSLHCGCKNPAQARGSQSCNWRGGRTVHKAHGYVFIRDRGHSNSNRQGYVAEHVKVMSELLGRPIRHKETIHHKNGIRSDNRPENLELWDTSHPKGQRVSDLVAFAVDILRRHAPDKLVEPAKGGAA